MAPIVCVTLFDLAFCALWISGEVMCPSRRVKNGKYQTILYDIKWYVMQNSVQHGARVLVGIFESEHSRWEQLIGCAQVKFKCHGLTRNGRRKRKVHFNFRFQTIFEPHSLYNLCQMKQFRFLTRTRSAGTEVFAQSPRFTCIYFIQMIMVRVPNRKISFRIITGFGFSPNNFSLECLAKFLHFWLSRQWKLTLDRSWVRRGRIKASTSLRVKTQKLIIINQS